MTEKLNWGILSTGAIAKTFANALKVAQTGRLLAVASRSQASADKFGQEQGAERRYDSYEKLLADKDVQAVYIAPPHPLHAKWAIAAADAGKHVLCEKPFAVNQWEAMTALEAAHRNGTFMMEAFMYRCHPQTARVIELIKQNAIGEVRMIEAAFAFQAGFNPEGRLYANDLAGGGIMDVGGYPVSYARLIAGVATGQNFADPIEVKGTAHLGSSGVDHYATAALKFPGGIIAQVTTGVQLRHDNQVTIHGSEGMIRVLNPYTADRGKGGEFVIVVNKSGAKEPEKITLRTEMTAFTMEADVVGRAIAAGQQQAPAPAMSWNDTMGNLRTLDAWRQSIGLTYNFEKPDAPAMKAPISGRPLSRRQPVKMKYGKVPGLDKPVSRLVMGVDNQRSITHASAMFDDFFERGGNTFDTAWVYNTEGVLGQWVRNRRVRDQVVLLVKGAHTPYCDPTNLRRQIGESLQRAKLESADIYMLHRDNPDIPVGEFVDLLNELVKEGRFKVFGGSNWALARVEEANAYAKSKGLQGFSAVSNNFSLAEMVDPVWRGCIHASDAASRAWLEKNQMALMPWSSQARGFFTDRAGPEKTEDAELVRCWYSPQNFLRRDRAIELARRHNVLPINIGLAYVLRQPFPTFPLIGPRSIEETRTSMPGLDVELSKEELRYLNLEA
ncbi:MAG: aldo/keto reductase [Phycisphaeraceae bacterium]